MFWLWLIVAILLIAVGSYVIGRLDSDHWDVDEKIGLFWAIFFGSLFWPAVLLAVMIVGPYWGLYWLGDRRRRQLKKEKSTSNK
jgi:uncharacterized BrkB/YihY/UPF0761 family membrane protein